MATTSKAIPKFEVPTISAPTKLLTLDMKTIRINLEGITPFLCHAWNNKDKIKMQEKQAGTASKGREKRDPVQDYEGAFYRLPDGRPGMKIIAFKDCAVTAVTSLGKEFTKVGARQAFFISRDKDGGDLTPLIYPEDTPPYMRTDTVKVGISGTDLRYRPEFLRWGVTLAIQFNARVITQDQLVNLINLGGFSVGVGEWRPEKNGDHGRFQVVSNFSWEAK